jgi:hypothetical protein
MKPALNDWVWAAPMVESMKKSLAGFRPMAAICSGVPMGMPRKVTAWRVMVMSTLVEANRFSEVPACSNRVKNTTAPKIRITASIIRWRSTQVLQAKTMIQPMAASEATMETRERQADDGVVRHQQPDQAHAQDDRP